MIQLIPAIDIIDGKCVRLSQGKYESKKVYNENPLEVAKQFEAHGIERLHLVDLDGAKANHIVNYKVLETIANNTNLVIDFGGGLKTDDDLRIAFESGAEMITGGSIAVKNPETFNSWIKTYGADRIILGADVKDKKIAVTGWLEDTDKELIPYLQDYTQKGISKVICTDISKDGMLQGAAVELYKEILSNFNDMFLIASGGVSCYQDIIDLNEVNIPAVIFGKAIYEGKITMQEIEKLIIK